MENLVKISQWGNSFAIRIPASTVKKYGLKIGEYLKLDDDKGIHFTKANVSVFDMMSEEFEEACRQAVLHRDDVPKMEFVTMIDEKTDALIRVYSDGRVEQVD